MKPFTINRKSWHYKLNANFFQENSRWGMQGWEHTHSSFCAYWRATVFRLILASIMAITVLLLFTMVGVAIYTEPMATAISVGSLVGFFALVAGIFSATRAISAYNQKAPESQSLLAQRYRAYKSKICPVVDFHN